MKYWLSDQILFHEKNYFILQKVEKLHIRVKTLRKRPTTKSQKKGVPHKKSWIFAFQYMMQECQCCLRFELHHKCHPSRKNMNEWTFCKTASTTTSYFSALMKTGSMTSNKVTNWLVSWHFNPQYYDTLYV